jgi:RimJ/RimL family protein N-acetyltransferase
MTILSTERLLLRPMNSDDLDDLCRLYADPEVMRYLGAGRPLNPRQAADRLERALAHWQKYGFGMWTVCARIDGRFLGRCGYGNLHDYPDMELAWSLHRFAWGQGYGTEVARAVIQHAFDVTKVPRLLAVARPGNIASLNLMRKLGMTYQRNIEFDGGDALLYMLDNPAFSK